MYLKLKLLFIFVWPFKKGFVNFIGVPNFILFLSYSLSGRTRPQPDKNELTDLDNSLHKHTI